VASSRQSLVLYWGMKSQNSSYSAYLFWEDFQHPNILNPSFFSHRHKLHIQVTLTLEDLVEVIHNLMSYQTYHTPQNSYSTIITFLTRNSVIFLSWSNCDISEFAILLSEDLCTYTNNGLFFTYDFIKFCIRDFLQMRNSQRRS
jgi:hypothetical protein